MRRYQPDPEDEEGKIVAPLPPKTIGGLTMEQWESLIAPLKIGEEPVCEHCSGTPAQLRHRHRTFVSHILCDTCFDKAKEALGRGEEI